MEEDRNNVRNEEREDDEFVDEEEGFDGEEGEENIEDYMSDDGEEDYAAIAEKRVPMDTSFRSTIIVDNLPRVGKDKYEKLQTVIQKVYNQIAPIKEMHMPFNKDEQPQTMGFAFITFATPEDAERAAATTDNWKLDKSHVFKVSMLDDFDRFMSVPDTYEAPEANQHQALPALRSWLLDARARDQFVIRHGEETEVMWNDPAMKQPQLVYGGEREKDRGKTWTEMYVAWSPRGSYLVTFHRQGIILWGGPKFEMLTRMNHAAVKFVLFSANEEFVLTYSGIDSRRPEDPESAIVWDVRTGKKLRGFQTAGAEWPMYKWSADGKFLARMIEDGIQVYESPSMKLTEDPKTQKRCPVRVEGVRSFEWSPTDNILSLWTPERDNTPARVTLMSIPSREEIKYKNLFNVGECKLHWQPNGDFLCVKVQRLTKSKKLGSSTLEVFRLREKGVSIEMTEIKDRVIALDWEPRGCRFAVIHGDGPIKYNVTFYTMEAVKGHAKLKEIAALTGKVANHVFWAPRGGCCVLAGLGAQMNGALEWVKVKEDAVESLAVEEHFMCTDVTWDPTGRYLITAVAQPMQAGAAFRYTMEAGFNIWTFQGKLLVHQSKERFFQILWRPRPPTMLTDEKEEKIKKNIREYSKKFEQEDQALKDAQRAAARQHRQAMKDQFMTLLAERLNDFAREEPDRIAIVEHYGSADDHWDYRDEMVEEVVDVVEEIIE